MEAKLSVLSLIFILIAAFIIAFVGLQLYRRWQANRMVVGGAGYGAAGQPYPGTGPVYGGNPTYNAYPNPGNYNTDPYGNPIK